MTFQPIPMPELSIPETHGFLRKRGLKPETLAKYGAGFTDDGKVVTAVYYNDEGLPVFAKHRNSAKKFWNDGGENLPLIGLYGWHSASTKKYLLIVEGEVDAWSAWQMLEGYFTVVSIPNGVADAAERVRMDLPRIEQYEKVYVAFDSDKQGQDAQAAVLDVLDGGYAVTLPTGYKDASDMLQAGEAKAFKDAVWAGQRVTPSGFVDRETLIGRTLDFLRDKNKRVGHSFGWPGLDEMFGGQRPGEVLTWVSGSGIGKSSLLRNLLWNLYKDGVKSAYLPFEDMTEVALTQLAQLDLGRNVLRLNELDEATGLELADSLDGMLQYITVLDKFDWQDPQEVVKKLEYAVRIHGARVLVLDHITWLAESSAEDSRIVLERVMPALKALATKQGVTIHIISHLSRDKQDKDDTKPALNRIKNSSAIVQVSDAVIGIRGNREENQLEIVALKQNRLWGRSDRESVVLRYNTDTTRLEETDASFAEGFDDYEELDDGQENAQPVRAGRNAVERETAPDDVRKQSVAATPPDDLPTRPDSAKRSSRRAKGSPPAGNGGSGKTKGIEPAATSELVPYEGGGFIPPEVE